MKGNLNLEIDEPGIEVRVTITPDPNGADLTVESITALLAQKKVRTGVDPAAIDRAFRALARGKTEPVTFVAAAGVPPTPAIPESVLFEPLPVPERLGAVCRRILEAAPPPRGFRLREERVKTEKKTLKKAALPFLPPREEVEVVVEKRMVREEVTVDPNLTASGYVTEGSLVARVRPGTQGREGKSVFGRFVPAPRSDQGGFLFLEGVTRTRAEVKAVLTGFLRVGVNWCDVVPFRDHSVTVSSSRDGLSCLLSFVPGDRAAPGPDPREVLSRAQEIGFASDSLLPIHEIESLMQDAILAGSPLDSVSISPAVNGAAVVTVSPDRLKAVLFLRKGLGGGTPLVPGAVSEAIRASKVKGFNPDLVRKDLSVFFGGKTTELADYVLAVGRPAKPGSEPKVEWRAMFLPAEEAGRIRASAAANSAALKSLASLDQFPLAGVEAVGRVKKDAEILRVISSTGGQPGVDVFGAAISPSKSELAGIRLFEGLAMRNDLVVATEQGILEKGSDGMAILLRVRPHRDAELQVILTPDRMKASMSHVPSEGDGMRISAADVRARLRQAGVQKGIDENKVLSLLDKVARGEGFTQEQVAEGRPPALDAPKRIVFNVPVATGRAVTIRKDGRADFRTQDRITRIRQGELVATVRPRNPLAEDGWDVTGKPIAPPPEAQEMLKAGRGIREDLQTDGSIQFRAERTGELVRDGPVLSAAEVHLVQGDVSMSTGNIRFPGVVWIGGSVRSGFSVVAEGVLEIGGSVEGALLSAEGSIVVGNGIKGEGKAVLRSKRNIEGLFAEQAVLLAVGDVHLHGPCVRCQVKCNGVLRLDSEKGTLVGGEVRASRGVEVQNIGSPGGLKTIVSFGQDFLVKDQIEREEREVEALMKKVAELDAEMFVQEKRAALAAAAAGAVPAQSQAAALLARARAQKVQLLKLIEQRKMRLITLRDQYDENVPSEVLVRGTLYPGAVLESHGRRYETVTEKRMITLRFDPVRGKIVEKL